MKKFLLGLLCGVLFALMIGFVAALVFAKLGDRTPGVADGSTLVLRLEGEIPEKADAEIPLPFLQNKPKLTVIDVWQILKKAAADPRIKAVILAPHGVQTGFAALEEIHADLLEFKKSGKPLFVHLRAPHTADYYLATAANKIEMVPEDLLDMKGIRAEITYYKGAFDKLGVKMEAEHAGKYKDFLDSYTRKDMSPETREVLNSLLDGLYGDIVNTIAKSRNKTPDEVRKILDNGPFMSDEAKQKGLVDSLRYSQTFLDEVKASLGGGELKKVSAEDYVKVPVSAVAGKNRIAIMVGEGAIVRDPSATSVFGANDEINTENMAKMFRQVAGDASIKGAILRVDSPGGDAFASDEILEEARRLSQKKPLIISMGSVAASGGYYISMTGDPVVAYPNTITGSIGVIYGKVNLHGLYDKLGLTKDVVQRGSNANIDSEYYELTPQGREKLRSSVDSTYKTFVNIVAKSRKRSYDQIHDVAQGRVWLGSQAKDHYLVDEIGGLDRAVELVKAKAKLGKGDTVRIVTYPARKSFLEQIFEKAAPTDVSVDAAVARQLRKLTGGLPIELFTEGRILRLAPFHLEIR